ncbi:MAG: hypothetical protein U0796_00080 [Gemmatales bacterium]
MGARNDLNEIYISGSLILAAVLGAMAQSWVVFIVVLVLVIGTLITTTKIR